MRRLVFRAGLSASQCTGLRTRQIFWGKGGHKRYGCMAECYVLLVRACLPVTSQARMLLRMPPQLLG